VLRDSDGQTLREHLIDTAAVLLAADAGGALTVREIARAGGVSDGVLYNHFADKEELLAYALHRHVGTVLAAAQRLPEPGSGTVEQNLRAFVRSGLGVLTRIAPAFARFLGQPEVLVRIHELFGHDGPPRTLPAQLADYLRAEQALGRIDADADPEAAATLLVGACHDLTLPRLLFDREQVAQVVPDPVVDALVATVLRGIAPG
jgi:AcrR family transcriptional regulator